MVVLVQLISQFPILLHMPTRPVCRMLQSCMTFRIGEDIHDPGAQSGSLPCPYLQDFRGRWTEIHASERSSGGWRRAFVTGLSQAFRASHMLVEMPCFVFEF